MHVYYLSSQLEYEPQEGRDCVYILNIQAETTTGEALAECLWLVKGEQLHFKEINSMKWEPKGEMAFSAKVVVEGGLIRKVSRKK